MDIVRIELADDPTIDITTTGRRSGVARRTEIWMLDVHGRFFITGTPGPRDWLANLAADAQLVVHLKRHAQLDLAARAVIVTDPEIRRLVIEDMSARWYRGQSSLDDLVATAPMVEVIFDAAPPRPHAAIADEVSLIVSAVHAALPATVAPWTVSAWRRREGTWTVELIHEASNGLVLETPDEGVVDAITSAVEFLGSNHEVERIARAPKLTHPDSVAGVRTLAQSFGWSRTEVRAVAGVMADANVLDDDEVEWLGSWFGEDRPPPRATGIT